MIGCMRRQEMGKWEQLGMDFPQNHSMSSAQLTLLDLFVFVFLGLFFWGLTDWAGRCEIHMGDLVSGRALGGQRKLSDNTLMLIWRRESERYLSGKRLDKKTKR